jgi:hypothetical protein
MANSLKAWKLAWVQRAAARFDYVAMLKVLFREAFPWSLDRFPSILCDISESDVRLSHDLSGRSESPVVLARTIGTVGR